ncbi:MAG TPA: glycoside hydrolase family 3 N-terminal domain-containing protein [Actinomycetota bacterium]|nr:glycoside hydrolase family 3 N-terminal domain-containing protein [Actinomycetota bacterium]
MADLLRRMTLAEKVGQMDQIVIGKLKAATPPANGDCNGGNNDPLQPACLQKVLITDHTGSILAGGTDNPRDNTGRGWAVQYNTIQRYAIQHSRLHIPIIFGVDAVHGFGHPFEATLFPQSIGMGATWDPALARAAGAATRQQLLATGGNWNFAPVQDLARDNRWGRYYETWAEAPVLAAAIGAANVRGIQGGGFDAPKVAATVKHFAGYSESINGHDRVEAQLSVRYLQDTFLPSYAGGIDAGAATVMVNSGSINGVPAHASHFLLTEELRNRLGFRGVVISDYGDVPALASAYHIAADLPGAVAKAVNAGIDMSMTPMDSAGWQAAMLQDVRRGLISERRVNEAVTRILTLKFKLGLFDHPLVDPAKADAAVKANRDLARRAADESITLLRNQNGTLPLATNLGKIVVTGPSAGCVAADPSKTPACQAAIANQLGGWSVSWQGPYQKLPPDDQRNCCIGPPDQIPTATTVLDGIKAAAPSSNVVWAPDQQMAVREAGSADAVVAVVGEQPYAEGLGDNPQPRLPDDQQALIAALEATGKPVIVVVIAGRPLGLGPAADADGLLMAYLPGTEGGSAVADVLFGRVNPSGHLSVSWPSEATRNPPLSQFNPGAPSLLGDQPKFFDQLPGTNSGQGSGYNPRYPFGFGLSYTTFKTSGLSVTGSVGRSGKVTATFTVANTGGRAGADVVPVYVHQPVSRGVIVVPPKRLVGFAKVQLAAGQSKVVRVAFPVSVLAVTAGDIDAAGPRVVQPGAYQVQVEDLSAGFRVTG